MNILMTKINKKFLMMGLLFPFSLLYPLESNLTSEKSYILKKSVVSASGFAQDIRDAPASISSISAQQLQDKPYRDLGEAISNIAGISTNEEITGPTGYNISIRGMPAQYTLILVDGKRQNVTPAAFPNANDSIFSSFMPPAAAIERIEVIKGPMSTLYGSDAIGGVVNIITKRNFKSWTSSFNFSGTLQEDKAFGNLYTGGFYTSGPLDNAKKWGLSLRGFESYRAYVSANNLSIIPTPQGPPKEIGKTMIVGGMESNIYNIGGRISYSPAKENYIYFDYDRVQYWQNKYPGKKPYASAPQTFSRNNYILTHLGDYTFGQSNTSIQYNSTVYNGRTYVKNGVTKDRGLRGDDVLGNTKLILPLNSSQLVIGGEYWFSSMSDGILEQSIQSRLIYQNNISLFAENELSILDNLILTLGILENYNFAFGFNTSPRAYLVYNALESLTFKGGFSTGYKVPTAAQLIDGPNGMSGTSSLTRILHGNPNLKPENSLNFEINALWETPYTNINLGAFYNKFSDKIIDGKEGAKVGLGEAIPVGSHKICSTDGFRSQGITNCFYPINIDEAIAYGGEVTFEIYPIDIKIGTLGLNLNYAFTKTDQTKGKNKGKPLLNIPAHNLNGSLNYLFTDILGLYIRGEFYAHQPKSAPGWLLTSDYGVFSYEELKKAYPALKPFFNSYFLMHIGGHYQLNSSIKLHFGIYNLLNQKFSDWFNVPQNSNTTQVNNYNYVHEGRRYFLSLNMEF
ncbi:TonB-dependent receptor [Helicobacter sp. 11S03491-1]|uniref:TonB-dependent receptor domain-containing protein n=1 Tax=Helicobacter sp. 11S03491-1 TaxID=1476196 RepID=UPI000BA4FD9B|nr:TonB-dependent receptor [Helicobacter sp. 11S03491-1]PAF41680.1 hypothetical protein BKH45_06200 [Helicobacter sp. 11S03491-1]